MESDSYSLDQVITCEQLITKTLNWDLDITSAKDFFYIIWNLFLNGDTQETDRRQD
jgi:hypothetical protein